MLSFTRFFKDNLNAINDFNTKCVLLEKLLLHETVGTENINKTKTMLIHDEYLKKAYSIINEKLNATLPYDVVTFVNQYIDNDAERKIAINDRDNLSTPQDLLLLSIANPYKNIFYYTQNMIRYHQANGLLARTSSKPQ